MIARLTSSLTLPEARAELSATIRTLNAAADAVEDRIASGDISQDSDGAYLLWVDVLRVADGLLENIRADQLSDGEDWASVVATAQALRSAAYLALIATFPDAAAYWAPEHQARISELDEELTPALRARMVAGALSDDARLAADPGAWAEMQAEAALWDSTVGDGLDVD